jgi:acyl-CoA synthetase (AMP-forming)/AMP-acid ligase II
MADATPIPNWGTIGRMLADNVGVYADRVAVVDGDRRLTYAELHGQARAAAKGLIAAGVGRGDLVACWAPNGWRWVVMVHAVWLIGAVIVPISSRLKVLEAGPILERTGAAILFTVAECAGTRFIDGLSAAYGAGLKGLPELRHLVRFDLEHEAPVLKSASPLDREVGPKVRVGNDGSVFAQPSDILNHTPHPSVKAPPTSPSRGEAILEAVAFADFTTHGHSISDATLERAIAQVQPGDICEIIFTSGTTGTPKGVQLTHAQLMRSYWDWSGIGGLASDDNYLVITPFSHGFGLNAGVIASALRGMCMVLLDIFEPKAALELIRRHRISVVGGPPNLFTRLMDQPGVAENPPTSLRVAFLGAASVPVEILRRVGSVLGIKRVINAYGLMEACVVSMTRADDDPSVISTTTGRALPDVEVAVVDDAGHPVPAGEAGEILVRGYGIMAGYWRDAVQTGASMSDGWFHTGDIGICDAAGNISIVDRKKDMFICGGFNAYPAEIEDLLLKIGSLSAVSVVGVSDPQRGESAVAFVVPSAGLEVDEPSVIAWARQNLAGYKVPRRVFVRDSLPLNPNGKVMKDALRREAADSLFPDAVTGR